MERLAHNSFCSFERGSARARFLRNVCVLATHWRSPLSRFVSSRLDGDKTAISSFRPALWTSDLRVRTFEFSCRERSLGRLRRRAAAFIMFILTCCWLALGSTHLCRARRSSTNSRFLLRSFSSVLEKKKKKKKKKKNYSRAIRIVRALEQVVSPVLWQWRNDSFLLLSPLENLELVLQFLNPFLLKTNRLQKSYLSLRVQRLYALEFLLASTPGLL